MSLFQCAIVAVLALGRGGNCRVIELGGERRGPWVERPGADGMDRADRANKANKANRTYRAYRAYRGDGEVVAFCGEGTWGDMGIGGGVLTRAAEELLEMVAAATWRAMNYEEGLRARAYHGEYDAEGVGKTVDTMEVVVGTIFGETTTAGILVGIEEERDVETATAQTVRGLGCA